MNAIIFKGNYIPAAFCLSALLYLFSFYCLFYLGSKVVFSPYLPCNPLVCMKAIHSSVHYLSSLIVYNWFINQALSWTIFAASGGRGEHSRSFCIKDVC